MCQKGRCHKHFVYFRTQQQQKPVQHNDIWRYFSSYMYIAKTSELNTEKYIYDLMQYKYLPYETKYLPKRHSDSFKSIAKASKDLLNQSTEPRQCQCPKVPKNDAFCSPEINSA